MLDNLNKYKVVLASNSPRRKELLSGLGIDYTIKTLPDIDESFPEDLGAEAIPVYIAVNKAGAYKDIMAVDELLITADTIVWKDNIVLGKPIDREDAVQMLKKLSGATHLVITGVCMATRQWQKSFSATTEVTFAALNDDEIAYYVDHYKPFDKAGSYGVQEGIGSVAVEKIVGSFYNVMGLPIQLWYTDFKDL